MCYPIPNMKKRFGLDNERKGKSGEVWCEGARIFLNPTSSSFSIKNARIALNYAVFFTPQYGDSYIEVFI